MIGVVLVVVLVYARVTVRKLVMLSMEVLQKVTNGSVGAKRCIQAIHNSYLRSKK